jgi:hypothetical protein
MTPEEAKTASQATIRNIALTLIGSAVVAIVTAIVSQGRSLVASQIRDQSQDEKIEGLASGRTTPMSAETRSEFAALNRRIDAVTQRIDDLIKRFEKETPSPK